MSGYERRLRWTWSLIFGGAETRARAEEIRHQENIEDITRLALQDLTDSAEPEKVDDDWISGFFERARSVTNSEMQALWARILAGEANKPGSIAKRTLDALASLERDEGLAFSALLNFGVTTAPGAGLAPDEVVIPVVSDPNDEIYTKHGVTFANLNHLRSIGLISYDSLGYELFDLPEPWSVQYYGKRIDLAWGPGARRAVSTGKVLLSQVGRQLAPVCEPSEVAGFAEHLAGFFRFSGAAAVAVVDV